MTSTGNRVLNQYVNQHVDENSRFYYLIINITYYRNIFISGCPVTITAKNDTLQRCSQNNRQVSYIFLTPLNLRSEINSNRKV
jgi:hypothetical protein